MPQSAQNTALFLYNKKKFFNTYNNRFQNVGNSIESTLTEIANLTDYFTLANLELIESEFTHLFTSLKQRRQENEDTFWAYCYYLASTLYYFYDAYGQKKKADDYQQFRTEIRDFIENRTLPQAKDEEAFIDHLMGSFREGITNLIKSPFHLSKLRDYVGFTNLCRLYWVFCRLTLTSGFNLARNLQWIAKLDQVLGTKTDVDKIITTFQAPNGILNYFSVGLFLTRFLMDAGMLIKHTFFPDENERRSNYSTRWERFKFELNQRQYRLANDFVWANVNFLTNFNQLVGISNALAGYLTAGFLCFDVSLLLYRMYNTYRDYQVKKAQYNQELNDLGVEPSNQKDILEKQLAELEKEWEIKKATLSYLSGAAAILASGFAAALLLALPAITVASYFMCTIAVAMYFTGDRFSQFKTAQLTLEAQDPQNDLQAYERALKEYQIARNDLIFNLVKHTVAPSILIASFAICWPIAVVLTAIYLGSELLHSKNQHAEKQEVNRMAIDASPAVM